MARPNRTVVASLAVRVPVNADGSLVDGASRIVERIEGVERVDVSEVRGLEPGLNDTTVVLGARITLVAGEGRDGVGERGEDLAVVRRALEAGVGIGAVNDLEVADVAPSPVSTT